MPLKVLHLSTFDTNGGAARAAYSLHRAMLHEGISSSMWVGRKGSDDPTVQQVSGGRIQVTSALDRQLWKLQRSTLKTWRSPARFSALSAEQINRSGSDIVNLHWVTDGFLSIEEIGKIRKPIVWSMYDMWPFSGTEHYGTDQLDSRWRSGYSPRNRPYDESGFDLDRWTYKRKFQHWRTGSQAIHMAPASTWLMEATQQSALMGDFPITKIPHVIDTEVFSPMSRSEARYKLGIQTNAPLALFLASAGTGDKRKGWDLLDQAVSEVLPRVPDLNILIVGPQSNWISPISEAPIHWHGQVGSNRELALLYNAADVTVVPSREDNMPLTAMEAQSCGRPVVAFSIGGLADIVDDGATGFLAPRNDTHQLARCLLEALTGYQATKEMGIRARLRAESLWSNKPVVNAMTELSIQVTTGTRRR